MNASDGNDAGERAAPPGAAETAADVAWTADTALGYEAADPARFAAEWPDLIAADASAPIARRLR